MYMIFRLTTWHWIANWSIFPRKDYFSCSQCSLVAPLFLSKGSYCMMLSPSRVACLLPSLFREHIRRKDKKTQRIWGKKEVYCEISSPRIIRVTVPMKSHQHDAHPLIKTKSKTFRTPILSNFTVVEFGSFA